LLSNRKFTGRKRIAFDSNVHKIAIFSDELEIGDNLKAVGRAGAGVNNIPLDKLVISDSNLPPGDTEEEKRLEISEKDDCEIDPPEKQ
jgi:hypothetical protein